MGKMKGAKASAKSPRQTPMQRLGDAYDQNISDHHCIGECLSRLELVAMEMGWHAEMLERVGAPRSAASSKKTADEIEAFCKAKRQQHGFNNDIPF